MSFKINNNNTNTKSSKIVDTYVNKDVYTLPPPLSGESMSKVTIYNEEQSYSFNIQNSTVKIETNKNILTEDHIAEDFKMLFYINSAKTAQGGGASVIHSLEDENVFLISFDNAGTDVQTFTDIPYHLSSSLHSLKYFRYLLYRSEYDPLIVADITTLSTEEKFVFDQINNIPSNFINNNPNTAITIFNQPSNEEHYYSTTIAKILSIVVNGPKVEFVFECLEGQTRPVEDTNISLVSMVVDSFLSIIGDILTVVGIVAAVVGIATCGAITGGACALALVGALVGISSAVVAYYPALEKAFDSPTLGDAADYYLVNGGAVTDFYTTGNAYYIYNTYFSNRPIAQLAEP